MLRRFWMGLFAVTLLLAGCDGASTDDGLDVDFFDTAAPVAYQVLAPTGTTVDEGSYAAIGTPVRRVIRDAASFSTFWQALYANQTPVPAVPQIDFSKNLVVAVVLGERPNGGYRVAVKAVGRADGVVGVHVEEVAPGTGCVTTQALTSAYQLITVPVTNDTFRFAETKKTVNCGAGS